MTLVNIPGMPLVPYGPGAALYQGALATGTNTATLDAANEAHIMYGYIATSDGASHTIDTTGSSSIKWLTGSAVTFADGATTVKVGLAAVDLATGPPGRAANVADVITFDVSRTMTGGGGGIAGTSTWQTHVPDAGTKTVANGDLVALAIQMTARGGVDSIRICGGPYAEMLYSAAITNFVGAAYSAVTALPIGIITFSDGALGYFYGSDIGLIATRTYNSGSSPNEYGQLYTIPFPTKVHGIYYWADPDANFDVILYSNPLGTPVAEKTVSVDSNAAVANVGRRAHVLFSSPYQVAKDQQLVVAIKPTSVTNISTYYKTLNLAAHRAADVWGTTGYGVSRAAGAFANVNVDLEHYYVGLLLGSFDDGTGGASFSASFG